MSFKHVSSDPKSERVLLVVLEEKSFYASEYRHIRATVIRRAVPHVKHDYSDGIAEWNDDYAHKCSGFRVASYAFNGKTPTYVDDMQLRGQIDLGNNPLNSGRPYSNKITFKPFDVCANSAFQIFGFFKKWEKFVDGHNLTRQEDDFYVALNHLAQFLKITKVVFMKKGVHHCSLSETNCFEEVDIAFAKVKIDEMLEPFAR
jgi:hypothetical protein